MADPSADDMRELLLGTWIGIALISDVLIRAGAVGRKDLLRPLTAGAAAAHGQRRIALAAMRALIETGFGEPATLPRPPRRRSRGGEIARTRHPPEG